MRWRVNYKALETEQTAWKTELGSWETNLEVTQVEDENWEFKLKEPRRTIWLHPKEKQGERVCQKGEEPEGTENSLKQVTENSANVRRAGPSNSRSWQTELVIFNVNVLSLLPPLPVPFYRSASLRYNLHTVTITHFQSTFQWALTNIYAHVIITTITIQDILQNALPDEAPAGACSLSL